MNSNQTTYGAPSQTPYEQNAGFKSTTSGAPHGGLVSNYDNSTTGLGNHPQQGGQYGAAHNQQGKESMTDKIKDHLSGNHSQNPQNGGGFGAGYTGNEHGHSNHHPQQGTLAHNQQNQAQHPSLVEKAKNVVTGDKHNNNNQYGAAAPSHVGSGPLDSTHNSAHNNTSTFGNDSYNNNNFTAFPGNTNQGYNSNTTTTGYGNTTAESGYGSTHGHHGATTGHHGTTTGHHGTTTGVTGTGVGAHSTHDGHHDHNKHNKDDKPSMGDKISGKIDVMVGKATKNDQKIAQGEAKQVFGKEATEHGIDAANQAQRY